MRRVLVGVLAVAAVASAIAVGLVSIGAIRPGGAPGLVGAASPEPSTAGSPSATPAPTPTPTPLPSRRPVVPPPEQPQLVPAPLTGVLVSPAAAARHPIAVMIDDLSPARPQSGFSAASVVWHAPAEGGIPRYMMIFAENVPKAVGPIRSSRQYYIAWAAEWNAMYAHVGGSPQAMATLRERGNGQLVYNADQFRWGGRYMWRIHERFAPHNVYSDGTHLRQLASRLGADDRPMEPAWRFAPQLPLGLRPRGGSIEVGYAANHIRYRYDWRSNTYFRSVTGEKNQVDAGTGIRVAPRNVIVMLMRFGPLNDGHPTKHRLEAQYVGRGTAWISTNGRTIKGTWRKARIDAPTRFFDRQGRQVVLAPGQTFIQVLQSGSTVTIKPGVAIPVPSRPSRLPL
ncbi:MAG TPA: DUF3048 domain-containing protein [Candidatus Limnocylindrales bacterium]